MFHCIAWLTESALVPYALAEQHVKIASSRFSDEMSRVVSNYFNVEITCFVSTGVKTVLFSDWEKIDSMETSKGEAIGKPREKILTVQEMLQVAHK